MMSRIGFRSVGAVLCITLHAGAALAQSADWLTFGGSNQRLGYSTTETALSQANVSGLKLHWTADIPGVGSFGAAANQPILMHNVPIKRHAAIIGVHCVLSRPDHCVECSHGRSSLAGAAERVSGLRHALAWR